MATWRKSLWHGRDGIIRGDNYPLGHYTIDFAGGVYGADRPHALPYLKSGEST